MTARNEGAGLGGCEKSKCFGEWDSEKQEPRYQRCDCHGNPNLLRAFLNRFNEIPMDFGSNGASFLSDEVAKVAGVAVQCEHANKSSDRWDVCR